MSLKIPTERLPRHIAVIMDGNGRWAAQRKLPRIAGHKRGMETVRLCVEICRELKISYLTLYAFSSENWRRPGAEVNFLMKLLELYLKKELKELHENQVKIQAIGHLEDLPGSARRQLEKSIAQTSANRGLVLTLALNYGGRREITDAAVKMATEILSKKIKKENITEDVLADYLYTAGMPDPDLLVRTSGELRLSNFLLWQSAYTEIYISKKMWPEFGRKDFIKAIRDYSRRDRRFGGIKTIAK
jgi:undecaprenyl diphosphate synthase